MKRMFCWLIACMMMLSPLAVGEVDSDNYNWYEVFVYSYQDSNGDGIGDLPGLMSRLDYIHDMGYDGLWLMPIMPSPSYHKYDVMDYMAVDPQYGTLEDFKALVAACHERGIRIIIDLPVNHTSTQHPWFLAACDAVCAGDMEDPFVSYYNFSQGGAAKTIPVSGTEWYYEEQFAGGNMPDLNLDNPAVLEEIRSIIGFWLTECDVDGFRLDAVTSYFTANTEKNIVLLNEIKAMAEATKPGSYLVGEVWTGLDTIAEYYKSDLDSFFLFPMSQAEGYIVRSLRSRNSPAETFVKYLRQVEEAIPEGILAPFLSNHDTGRTIPALQARQAPDKAKFAEGVLNMLTGNVFTYYGEEIGMVGAGEDPNKRLPMYWNDSDMTDLAPGVTKVEYAYPCADDQLADPDSLLNYCREVNHIRLENPAIARGENKFILDDKWVCAMERTYGEETLVIAMNFSASKEKSVELPIENMQIAHDLEVGEGAAFLDGSMLTLPPYGIVILK